MAENSLQSIRTLAVFLGVVYLAHSYNWASTTTEPLVDTEGGRGGYRYIHEGDQPINDAHPGVLNRAPDWPAVAKLMS